MDIDTGSRMIKKVVLLGEFGPPLLTFARSCKSQGIQVYLLEINTSEAKWLKYSSSLSGGSFIKPDKINSSLGIHEVVEYINCIWAEALIAVSDSHLLWLTKNRDLFEPQCKILSSSYEVLEYLQSKQNQINIAEKTGFNILPTRYIFNSDGAINIPNEYFPICLRPSSPTAIKEKFKMKLFFTPNKLSHFLKNITFLKGPIIAQPFVNLPNLIVHGIRSELGEIIAMEAFLVTRKFEGVTLSIRRTEFPNHIRESCLEFALKSGVVGCFHFELLFSPNENKTYFLEINPRLGGTTEKVFRIGFNEPALCLKAFNVKGPNYQISPRSKYKRTANKRMLIKHILYAIIGKLSEFDYPPVCRFKHICLSLYELFFVKDSVFDWNDIRGSIWFHTSSISKL